MMGLRQQAATYSVLEKKAVGDEKIQLLALGWIARAPEVNRNWLL